jgi:hypothetical protein
LLAFPLAAALSVRILERRETMFDYAHSFDAEIKKGGAKTLAYMTWAFRKRPETHPAPSKAHRDLAKELDARLAPACDAWAATQAADPSLMLYEKDQVQPNTTGM